MKLRIGIDACTWANRRGYGRFTRMLVATMMAEYPEHEYTLVLDQYTARGGGFPTGAKLQVVELAEQPTEAASADGARGVGDLWKLSRAVSKAKFDVFFFPTSYSFFPLFCRTPTVIVFHDAIAEQHPKLIFPGWRSRMFWQLKSWLARRRAKRVVTVSNDARQQLADVFGIAPADIEVISEGPDPCFRPITSPPAAPALLAQHKIQTNTPVILYVGGISPHKNLQGLLRGAAGVAHLPWHLVFVGDYKKDSFFGCYQEVQQLASELGLAQRVSFTGFLSDEDLVILCNVSTLLALPSFSEGFGLPVIEAMACGLPVAASNRNSLPEIVGDAGLLFDPLEPAQITAVLERLLTSPELRAELKQKGLQRSEIYSWKSGARKMCRILEEAARA
jgi:glycosyltransferase involved in cell wall biosynthesis